MARGREKLLSTERYDWSHYVALSGDAGRRWIKEYHRAQYRSFLRLTSQSIGLLREKRIDEGEKLLKRAGESLKSQLARSTSISDVLGRFYHGAVAYLHYCLKSFDCAKEELQLAHESVASGIERQRFLIPMAVHCAELRLQRARIAGRQRAWKEMQDHVETARKMLDGELPLCILSDGAPVRMRDLKKFYNAIVTNDDEKAAIYELFDDGRRKDLLNKMILEVYAVPGFVISY